MNLLSRPIIWYVQESVGEFVTYHPHWVISFSGESRLAKSKTEAVDIARSMSTITPLILSDNIALKYSFKSPVQSGVLN